MKNFNSTLLFALSVSLATLSKADAQSTPAVEVNSGTVGLTGWAMGWTFSTSTTINVTHLGKFDANGGGLAADVQVGLYSVATNSLITSVTVLAASAPEANGSYNAYYASITPVVLAPGDYFVGATDQGNDSFVRNDSRTMAPEITWGTGRAKGGSSGALPATVTEYTTTGSGYFGPTFKYDTGGGDTTPPTLAGSNIVDDQSGGSVTENTLVTYTVTFSEDMDAGTFSSTDFDNAGTSNISIGAITETSPGVFSVPVTPTDAGTLQLRVPVGATLDDAAGNPLNTGSAILDDTTLTVTTGGGDTTPPTLAGSNIVDDQSGGSVTENTLVTYTVTFSEDMDAGTFSSTDFDNAGTSNISIGAITETSPGVFSVPVTPTDAGTLQLRVPAGATLDDAAGNPLNTGSAILDDTTLTVTTGGGDTTPPTLAGSNIVDDQSGGSVTENTLVTYTVTFSEDMDAGTFSSTDFDNAGTSNISIGAITETSPGVFSVPVTPTDAGTLQLRVPVGATLDDAAGNPLNTGSAILDDTTLTVNAASTTATAAVSVNSGTVGLTGWGMGWTFSTSTAVRVTELGKFDANGGGLAADAQVGLYSVTSDTLITSVTVSAASAPEANGSYNVYYASITPVVLPPGDYFVAATDQGSDSFLRNDTRTMAPEITWGTGRALSGSSGTLQATVTAYTTTGSGYFGPTFKFDTGPDETPPTLAGSDIVDDQGGGSVNENTAVNYTVTFSEDMDDATVTAADFSNAGTAPIGFGTIIETSPGVFNVVVTPTSTGTLQLQVPAGAALADTAGNTLNTTSAIVDDTTLTVTVAPPDNTAPTPNPMTFATAPYPSTATSIAMEASIATDTAGVEYLFTETSGNPGADDSGWQSDTSYEDTGLTTGLVYTYTVMARDLSANKNATAPSDPSSATAETPVIPPTITAPTSRHIVQRTASNVGTIEIEGTYTFISPDEIEARAVVMTGGGNSGTTTAWQTIDAAPSGGSFSGSLTGVPAGGWYQLEVRSVTGGTPGTAAVLEKVGVGDIYVTAGQSNSANHGSGKYTPTDDRVCARDTFTGSTWVFASDPILPATGTGASLWSRLGDQLAAAEDIPIGFMAVGVGGTTVGVWVPGSGNYNNRLRPAIQSFPANGFRAALWHQGESDTVGAGTSAATYASRLSSIISQSRIDGGWDIPWYIAEASYHSNGPANQERVVAGQRLSVHGDPLTFLGETTEDLHLEDANGGKSAGVHFNAAGLDDRAQQYLAILTGATTITPKNGHFEDNRTPAITGLSPLADGTSDLVVVTDNEAPRPLGWHILTASGVDAADGSNGFHNPSTGTYAGAVDTVNGGVLPNMNGKHVALLDGGSADNYFLHSTRALAETNTTYTLTVALGVRDNPATFSTARLEITADGTVVASGTFDKAALDTLRGSDASGTFTDASVSWSTGATVATNQPLAIRVVKEGGVGTVLDFDNARLTATPVNDFNSWISAPGFGLDPVEQGFSLDPDGDRLANGLEAWFGTHPGEWNTGLAGLSTDGTTTTFTHPQNASPPSDVTGFYQWSLNLVDWHASGSGPGGGPIVTLVPVTVGTTTTVTATASEALDTLFLRVGVSQN